MEDVVVFDKFVKCRNVVFVKWTSDDPDYFKPQEDLFDFQKNGISTFFGKKDKQTTEQGMFVCVPCGCEVKSLSNLKAHCSGLSHIRKESQILFEQKSAK